MKNRILHIFNKDNEKFSKGYFEFLRDNKFDLSQHFLFHYGDDKGVWGDIKKLKKYFAGSFLNPISAVKLLFLLFRSKKIIVHCLASPVLLLWLFLFPCLCKKVYWVVWGKDLYFYKLLEDLKFYHKIYEFFRKRVIRNIGNVVTYIDGDFELLKKWYQNNGQYFKCFMYPSNIYKDLKVKQRKSKAISIQIGNSSDPSNRHIEVLKKLKPFQNDDIQIYTPLSYGEKKYAQKIKKMGKEFFNKKFIPMMEMLPFDKYLAILGKIDIAIFNHRRQQAMGNIISLLGLGKKVYIRSDITTWKLFENLGIKVYDINEFCFKKINTKVADVNRRRIKKYFSNRKLTEQWIIIFKK